MRLPLFSRELLRTRWDRIRPHPWLTSSAAILCAAVLCLGVFYLVPSGDDPPPAGEPTFRGTARPLQRHHREVRHPLSPHQRRLAGQSSCPKRWAQASPFSTYDNDGRPDLLFINSCPWPGHSRRATAPTLALYRNNADGTFDGRHRWQAGLDVTMYGMGVAVGDFDNDGFPDVFVTGIGQIRLFRNLPAHGGGRRFEDVTRSSGDLAGSGDWPERRRERVPPARTADPLRHARRHGSITTATACSTCSSATTSPGRRPRPEAEAPIALTRSGAYAPPSVFDGTQCLLYRNLGGGRFEDVSAQAGIHVLATAAKPVGKSLGVIVVRRGRRRLAGHHRRQ